MKYNQVLLIFKKIAENSKVLSTIDHVGHKHCHAKF